MLILQGCSVHQVVQQFSLVSLHQQPVATGTPCYFVDHPEIVPLQMSFAKAGYQTYGAGKLYHHGAGAIDIRGWTEFFFRNEWQRQAGWSLDSWAEDTPIPQPFPNSIYNRGTEITGGMFLEWGAVPEGREQSMADTARVTWAVEKLKEQHDQPFFLGVGLYAPHYPNYCPQEFFDLYDRDAIKLPPVKADDLDDLPPKIKKIKTARSRIPKRLEELGAMKDAIHGYLACISYADAMLGRVLDALEASPYAKNTIVVMWSDHGYHLGEKGDWGKHTLWERTSNVPFVWAGPGIAKGAKVDATASLIDMYPTLVGMCGLPKPKQHLEGTSLVSTLADPATARDRDVFLPHMHPGEFAVMNRDWRYIRYGEDGEELYNLKADPNEWDNLAGDPAFETEKAKLRVSRQAYLLSRSKISMHARALSLKVTHSVGNEVRGITYHGRRIAPTRIAAMTNQLKPAKKKTAQKNQSGRKRPNILFVVCDDLNTHVSPSGYDAIRLRRWLDLLPSQ
jgi:arylsulfatase A-like enzyme